MIFGLFWLQDWTLEWVKVSIVMGVNWSEMEIILFIVSDLLGCIWLCLDYIWKLFTIILVKKVRCYFCERKDDACILGDIFGCWSYKKRD